MIALPERVSIEVTRRCAKQCHFCYNHSHPGATDQWRVEDLVTFIASIAAHGTRAVSLGGGEPLEYEGLDEVIAAAREVCFVSMTTNGLLLDDQLDRMARMRPHKVHLSVHFPGSAREVSRVIRQVLVLRLMGIRAGVNLLVRGDRIEDAAQAASRLRGAGIGNEAIVYLPMRGPGANTPSPAQMQHVAGGARFQSMTCLGGCAKSARFCSIDARARAAHCSYTDTRRALPTLAAAGLAQAIEGLGLRFCGEA